MKKTKLFALAFAALALGACSSDDLVEQKNPTVTPGEKGYVSVALNLPTQPTARANDAYDDGLPVEYKVNDATLLLFKGKSEASATFTGAYELDVTGFADNAPADDNITSNATLVQKVTKPSTADGENIYALVVVNDNGKLTVANDETASLGDLALTGKTYSDFAEHVLTTNAAELTADGFFMSNAPLSNVAGGTTPTAAPTATVTTLAVIDPDNIYPTIAEASSNPAANIYVERAVAKVTVNAEDAEKVTDGNPKLAGYEVEGWTFNVANTKTYAVRNVEGANWWAYTRTGATDYRFLGNVAVAENLYRTYWGYDPNYSTAYNAADFEINSNEELDNTTLLGFGENNPGYCLENTFDIANQIENRTTAVVVKAKLKVTGAEQDGTFYTVNGNTSTIYQKAGVEDLVKIRIMDWLEENKATYIANGTIEGTDLVVTLSNATTDKGGIVTVTSVVLPTVPDGVTLAEDVTLESLNEAIATQVANLVNGGKSPLKISYYKDGYAYYDIKIKHFGDQTPWAQDGQDGYTKAEDFLGRYGALRNNWYDITVTGIKNIGSPSVPDVTNKWDDPEDNYIAVSINILSWAKRTQNADL